MSDDPAKVKYALDLLCSLEEMRQGDIICDFQIKVDGESFPVHRTVLAASSRYFRGALQSDMIESKQGFINLQGLEARAVRICVKYMYSGDPPEFVPGLVESIARAAHLMQLDGLADECFMYLQNNISAVNCISTISFSRLYSRHNLEGLAEEYLLENLGAVSSCDSFSSITKSDLVHYLNESTSGYQVLWHAVTSWVHPRQEDKDQVMEELVETIEKIKDFPFDFLLEVMQDCDLVKNSPPVRDSLLQAIFSKDIRHMMTSENLFTLRDFIQKSKASDKEEMMEQVKYAMLQEFEDLTEMEEFVNLDEGDILMFLRSPETKCFSEEIKWRAILKWTKYVSGREKSFTKLFKLLRLKRIPKEIIRDDIRVEPMVMESTECMNLLLEVAFDQTTFRAVEKDQIDQTVALLCNEDGGILTVFDDSNDAELSVAECLRETDCELQSEATYGMVSQLGKIYIMVEKNFFRLDGDGNWTRLQSLPLTCEGWPKMANLNESIYVLIGREILACYNTLDENWKVDLPGCETDPEFCTVASRKSLIAVGGRNDGNVQNQVKEYDPSTNSWSNMTPMLTKRCGPSAAMLREMLIVAGGQGEDGSILHSVECHVRLARSWTMLANMNTPRYFSSMFVVNNKVYVCGNDRSSDGSFRKAGTIEVFLEGEGKWEIVVEEAFLVGFVPTVGWHSV